MRTHVSMAFIALISLTSFSAFADSDYYKQAHKYKPERLNMRLFLSGTKVLYECEIPPTDQGTTIVTQCHDHDVIDLRTNQIIGTATDALADVTMNGGSFSGTNTVIFRLKQGTFVVRGKGGGQPVVTGNPSWTGQTPITHMAAFFPEQGQDNILTEYGTGMFKNATGKWNLLGAIDMSRVQENLATFYCLFEIDMELNQ